MKNRKMTLIILSFLLVLSLAACGGKPVQDENASLPAPDASADIAAPGTSSDLNAGLANPMTAYDSLEEINEIVGSKLCSPAVMGVGDKAYFVYNLGDYQMAEYQFTVAGLKYNFRSAPVVDKDISGLHVNGGTAFQGQGASEEIQYAESADAKAARWFTIDGQYVLAAADEGKMDKDTFLSIAEELRICTLPGMSEGELAAFYAGLSGKYEDSVSQRAWAEVTANGSESVTIVVHWSSSAFEYDQWTMTARLAEDGLLSYPGEEHSIFTTDADGSTMQMMADAALVPGWFEFVDGKLLWTGANDEQCRACVFEKIELTRDPLAPTP